MKIGYLTSLYARGTDSFIRGEVLRLREIGFDVKTFSIRKPSESEATNESIRAEQQNTYYLLEQGILSLVAMALGTWIRSPVSCLQALFLSLRCSIPGIRGRALALVYWLEACALVREVRKEHVEHLHNHIGQNSATVAMLVSCILGIPYSLTIHGPLEFDRPATLAIGTKISRSSFTVAVSEYGRSQMMRWTPMSDWHRIKVVRCGVDPSFLSRSPSPPNENRRFVCIGRLAEQKGIPVLVQAAYLLRQEQLDFEIEIIGDGPLKSLVIEEIKRFELDRHLKMLGLKSPEVIQERIIASRAMVLPSFAEGLPVVLMESLALGRPAIATYIAGIPELIRNGSNGWLVPAGSASELASAMKTVLQTPTTVLAEMGRSGIAIVNAEHNQRTQAEKLGALFRGCGSFTRRNSEL